MSHDLLGTVKAELSRREPLLYLEHYIITDWLRALVDRCERAEADLAVLRQRHAEAVEKAFRAGYQACVEDREAPDIVHGSEDEAWSAAKARLT